MATKGCEGLRRISVKGIKPSRLCLPDPPILNGYEGLRRILVEVIEPSREPLRPNHGALFFLNPSALPSYDTVDTGNGQNQPLDRSITPLIPNFMDKTVAYFPTQWEFWF